MVVYEDSNAAKAAIEWFNGKNYSCRHVFSGYSHTPSIALYMYMYTRT